jgi:hypothetical protein
MGARALGAGAELEFTRPPEPIQDAEAAVFTTSYTGGGVAFDRGVRRRWDDRVVQAHREFWRMAPQPVPEVATGLRLRTGR